MRSIILIMSNGLISTDNRDLNFKGTRGHTLKLEKPGCHGDSKKFFSHGLIGRCIWNSLDQETVDAPSINAFKGRLDKLRQTRTDPLSPTRHGMIDSPVRPHKVRYKVRYRYTEVLRNSRPCSKQGRVLKSC